MQNSNKFIDSLVAFLKSNNIKYEDLIERFFDTKNSSINTEEESEYKSFDKDIETENETGNEYDLLINKLNNIQKHINQLSLVLKK